MNLKSALLMIVIAMPTVLCNYSSELKNYSNCPNLKTPLGSVRKRRHLAFPTGSTISVSQIYYFGFIFTLRKLFATLLSSNGFLFYVQRGVGFDKGHGFTWGSLGHSELFRLCFVQNQS